MLYANKGDMTQVEAALTLLFKPQGDHLVLRADGQNNEWMFLFVSNAATLTATFVSALIRSHGQTHSNIRLQEQHRNTRNRLWPVEQFLLAAVLPACKHFHFPFHKNRVKW